MTRYDRSQDRRLTFSEFSEAFLPLEMNQASVLNRRKPNMMNSAMYRRDDCFLADTQIEFRSMWRTHFKIECSNETLRQKLNGRPLFNVAEAFNSLDINADGRISLDELRRLIESRGYFVSAQDVS